MAVDRLEKFKTIYKNLKEVYNEEKKNSNAWHSGSAGTVHNAYWLRRGQAGRKFNANRTPTTPEPTPYEELNITYKRVSVHDPSIIKVEDTYYIFGSHKAWAKSTDLFKWTTFNTNINSNLGELFEDIWNEWSKTDTNPNMDGNMWAPDVIYNEAMGKYCFYMSVNGNDWNSVITLLTADDIEGDRKSVVQGKSV